MINKKDEMSDEYDFSNAVRSKYSQNTELNLPIYLEPKIEEFITQLAKKKNRERSEVGNTLLLKDKELFEFMLR